MSDTAVERTEPTSAVPKVRRLPVRHLETGWTLIIPLLVVALVTTIAGGLSTSIANQAEYALVNLVIVLGLQIFVGTSGVLSFGHIAFVAIGAWTFGLTTIDPTLKHNLMPGLSGFLGSAHTSTLVSVVLAVVLATVVSLIVGPLLMRLNGLQAGIATFALLGVVTQVLTYWTKIGPPSGQSMVGIRTPWDLNDLLLFALGALMVNWLYQHTTTARLLRASRENLTAAPGSGIHVTLHRVVALALSAAVCGLGGALWAETNTVVQASQLSVDFTFTVIAMLVLGGTTSMWGAVVGVVVYSALNTTLTNLESGVLLGGYIWTMPGGARPLVLGAALILMVLFRPQGLTGGRELHWPFSLIDWRLDRN